MTYVLIPARNEAERIGRLLDALSTADTPIVLPNDCSDHTAAIARGYGAIVLEQEAPGKMPALQAGFRFLANRAIGKTVITTDADCWPVLPWFWAATINSRLTQTRSVENGNSAVCVGPVVHRYGPGFTSNVMRTALHYSREIRASFGAETGSWPGKNMGLWIANVADLDALLAIPHYWPGEDIAIKDTIQAVGGEAVKCLSPRAAVYSEARYDYGFFRQLSLPRAERIERSMIDYMGRGAEGSIPYPGLTSLEQMSSNTRQPSGD